MVFQHATNLFLHLNLNCLFNVLKAPPMLRLIYRTSQAPHLLEPRPKTPLLCRIQSEDLLLLWQPGSRRCRYVLGLLKALTASCWLASSQQRSRVQLYPTLTPQRHKRLPVLEYLRFPALLQLRLSTLHLLCLPHLALNPLPRPQHLALQVETTSLLRIVHVE